MAVINRMLVINFRIARFPAESLQRILCIKISSKFPFRRSFQTLLCACLRFSLMQSFTPATRKLLISFLKSVYAPDFCAAVGRRNSHLPCAVASHCSLMLSEHQQRFIVIPSGMAPTPWTIYAIHFCRWLNLIVICTMGHAY